MYKINVTFDYINMHAHMYTHYSFEKNEKSILNDYNLIYAFGQPETFGVFQTFQEKSNQLRS